MADVFRLLVEAKEGALNFLEHVYATFLETLAQFIRVIKVFLG
jgi:hypothetical protein